MPSLIPNCLPVAWSAALTLLLGACVAHEHQAFDYRSPVAYTMPASVAPSLYDYSPRTAPVETFPLPYRQMEGYDVYGIRFPSSGDNGQPDNQVEARYFESRQQGPRPLLIVLPIWATHTFPSTVMAGGYALHTQGGANILWLQGDAALFDWSLLGKQKTQVDFEQEVDRSVERFRMAVIDTRQLIDWAESRPEIDGSRIAIIGFSMSAIVAANVAGVDPRVSTAVYVLGGAQPWEVMSYCSVVVGGMRKRAMRNLDWNLDQFRSFFRDKLAFGDPALWRGRYRPEGGLIIEATEDDCIPPASRESLWLATGRPERIVFPYNHWQPFLAMTPVGMNLLTEDIFDFLDRKLFPAQYGERGISAGQ